MTAKQQKAASSETTDELFGSLNGVFELFISRCVDDKVLLAAFDAIPTQSDSQRRWVTYWKANVLLALVSSNGDDIETGDPAKSWKRMKRARQMFEQLISVRIDRIPENERELVFGAMIQLGGLMTDLGKSCELLLRAAALTRFHKSPLADKAEAAYNHACDSLLRVTFESLQEDSENELIEKAIEQKGDAA